MGAEFPEITRRRLLLGGAAAAATPLLTPACGARQNGDATAGDDGLSTAVFRHAEQLAGVRFTSEERQMMAGTIDEHLQRLRNRRSLGVPEIDELPALTFDPRLRGRHTPMPSAGGVRVPAAPRARPISDEDIAFAPVSHLSSWVRERQVTCQRLARVYLERLGTLGPKLNCLVTLMDDGAMERARALDIEVAQGHYRGPLHGIPWGAKDIFDTAGVRTAWGAAPYRDRVPDRDAAVVRRLHDAGAILIGKLSVGALAYGDIWYGGVTRNPFNMEQGSSGSSAGSAAATAAGLTAFALGTETYGSIVSPCMRCGSTGLRPTFGRVARTGTMPLCWSLDKIGPICRTVADTMLVLDAINGADDGDPASVDVPLPFDAGAPLEGIRVGYDPAWFARGEANELDRSAFAATRRLGVELVEVSLPKLPYDVLLNVLFAEASAVFEDLTRSDRDDELTWQDPTAWPNAFRQSWFIPAIEYVQADRFRRRVMTIMADLFDQVDVIVSPSFAESLLLITNNTGHPSLTLRCGFDESGAPRGITLWGRLYDEGTLCRLGVALEQTLDVWSRRPVLG